MATDAGVGYRLSDRFVAERGRVFLTGIQALARIPVDQLRADRRAGLRTAAFVSGYPGSPLGGFDRAVASAASSAPDLDIVCRPAMNEEYAATAVMGSQLANARPDPRYDGVVGLWYGKAPGVDRASDALRHAAFAGTWHLGGAVALVGDDPTAKSSTIPSSSAGSLADMNFPLLYPADPAEALDLGLHAVAMSRATGLWVALKIVADVADGTATVDLDPDRVRPVIPTLDGQAYVKRPEGRLLTPRTLDVEREILEVRQRLVMMYAASNRLNDSPVDPADAWIGIVASGITYREVREAFTRLGLREDADIAGCGIRLLKMRMPIPFDPDGVRRFARGLTEILVIEEKQPNIELLIKDALYASATRPIVVGKYDDAGAALIAGYGGLDADAIMPALRRRLQARLGDRLRPDDPPEPPTQPRHLIPLDVERSPFYCSGCPHNRSTEVPDGTVVGAGIGCHTMTLFMDPERVGDILGVTVMGNEGTQWIGMSDFVETKHIVQNLGDGTYFHSGQLAIQAAIAAKVDITYKLLYNGAVAMTGGQVPQGQLPIPAVVSNLLAQGVARVLITSDDPDRSRAEGLPAGVDVWDRDRLIEAQQVLAKVPGVTVLIHDQACAAEARRARKRGLIPTPAKRIVINHRVCEGCGDCGQVSNCLSVQPFETPYGRKTQIDQTTCNLDYSCVEGDCPSFITVTSATPSRLRRLVGRVVPRRARPSPTKAGLSTGQTTAPTEYPVPAAVVPIDDFAVRITGIGGTGVVTVAQILGTAAMLDGFHVNGLDQIGLSQKAGPVVSDVRWSRRPSSAASRIGDGQADLLLAFDLIVAASPKGLDTACADRTVVVGSTSIEPTGAMITHPEIGAPPPASLIALVNERTRDAGHWADAEQITADLFGDAGAANMLVVGMAIQAGCLPVDPAQVERAIELNGVAVAVNVAALRWGRCLVADPTRVDAARAATVDRRRSVGHSSADVSPCDEAALPASLTSIVETVADSDADLAATLRRLTADLIGYQNAELGARYLDTVERVATAEQTVSSGSTKLTHAVAVNLHKLLAYKDEYEVARLMLDDDAMRQAYEIAGADGRVAWQLHPPMLRALGVQRKLSFGARTAPAFRLLARGKRLRGTAFDPFRWSKVRRLERQLPGEYQATIASLLDALTVGNLAQAVDIAGLPDVVRGYEHLKLARAATYRRNTAEALAAFRSGGG